MRVLIVGGTGFIGQNLCLYFAQLGIEFDVLKRDWDHKPLRQEYDLVYYLAGEVRKPEEMYDTNVKLLYSVLSMSLQWNCGFVYIGSSSEYGRHQRPMREVDRINPTNLYDATKGMGTLLCQGFAKQFNRRIVIVRPSAVYGKYERPGKFIPAVIKRIKNGMIIDVYQGSHDWIHVDDLIRGISTILIGSDFDGEIYNISSGVQHNNGEIVQIISRVMHKDPLIMFHEEKFHEHDTNCWVVDNSKVKALGWEPQYDIYTGLDKTVKEILARL
jgi:nucleoside-diphosphate-sugar epimerase